MAARWTPEEDELALREWPRHTAAEVADMVFELSGRRVKPTTLTDHVKKLAHGDGSRNVNWAGHPEYDGFLREYTPGHTAYQTACEMERRFGVRPTVSAIKNRRHWLGLSTGKFDGDGRFRKGNRPANKGKRWCDYMSDGAMERCRAGQFKPGDRPSDTMPVGSVRKTKDGYLEIKVADRAFGRKAHDNWVPLSHIVWQQANGRMLEDGESVMFADGDRGNFDPANLVAVTNAERLRINRERLGYADAETLSTAANVAALEIEAESARTRRKANERRGSQGNHSRRDDGSEELPARNP